MKLAIVCAAAALAFGALPAIAAAHPVLDPPGGTFPARFMGTGGSGTVRAQGFPNWLCSSSTANGEFNNSTTGTVRFTFHGCAALGAFCTSPGQPSGTIATGTSEFHLVTVNGGKVAALITPPSGGIFTTFACFGTTISVGGNGVIGAITNPGYNELSSTFTLDFNATGSVQEIQEGEEEPGTKYHLTVTKSGSTPIEASEEFEGTDTFEGGKAELT